MWELDCEASWAPKNWCFWTVVLVPWTARRSNQFILKEISPGCSLEGLMLKLKLQYFGHLMWRVDSLEKILKLGGNAGRRRRGRQRMDGWMASPTRWAWVWVNSGSWWWTGRLGIPCCDSWGHKESDTIKWLDWTERVLHLPFTMYALKKLKWPGKGISTSHCPSFFIAASHYLSFSITEVKRNLEFSVHFRKL